MNHRTPAEERLAAAKPALTREQLEAENAALYDIFAAVNEASEAGVNSDWLVGYVQGIGSGVSLATLRTYAAGIRAKAQPAHDHDDADDTWLSGAHEFIPCTGCAADACNACSRPASDAVHRIAGDFGPQQVTP